MDVLLTRRQLLLLAIESTYGTDAAPQEANSYEALRLVDPFTLDLGQEHVEVTAGNLSRGMQRPYATNRPAGVTFRTYVQGLSDASTYTANDKPPIGDALRACGLFETLASGAYTYDPTAAVGSDSSVTIVAHQDGYEHRFVGCRGNVNFIYVSNQPVVAEFNFRGLLTTEASTTRSAPTGLPTVVPPSWIGGGSIHIESLQANIENANFNTNNKLFEQRASTAGSASGIIQVIVTERAPGGSIDPEATDPNSFDFFGAWRSSSGAILTFNTGVTSSNKFTVTASQAVLKTVAWGDKEGMSIFATDFQAYERSSNDEFQIVFN